jgi:putrescine transport system ATP-binding protein
MSTSVKQKITGGVAADAPWRDPDAVPFVRLSGVRKYFDNFAAVDGVDLEIYEGELFCLLGGSGCGKTTLLRMLAGLERPSAGRISIDGVDMANLPPYERPVNMMFQSYALFPHMTVERNVAYGLKKEGLPAREIATRVSEMLNMVQLSEFASRKPEQLSGGQRQRVALARALVLDPTLVLADEPTGNLDPATGGRIGELLLEMNRTRGTALVVVTHNERLASRLGRTLSMEAGVLVESNPTRM